MTYFKRGYCDDNGGYSGLFSWWRSTLDAGKYRVCGFDNFCKDALAVVDDFGNLVEV